MLKNRYTYSTILLVLLSLKTHATTKETRTISFKGIASQVKITSYEISEMSMQCSYDENYCTDDDRLFSCKYYIQLPMLPTIAFRFPEGHLIENKLVDKGECARSLEAWLPRNQNFPISAVITEVKKTSISEYEGNCIKQIDLGYTGVINNGDVANNTSRTSTKVDPIFCKQ